MASSIGKSASKIASLLESNSKKATNNSVPVGKNVVSQVSSQAGKTSSNVGKSANKIAENAKKEVKKANDTVISAVNGGMASVGKTLGTSASKLKNAVIGSTGITGYNDGVISTGKKQTNGEINVANLPVYNRVGNYIEGQKVKVKGLDGKWYVGTVKLDGYVGTGGARLFKFVPDNPEAYSKGNSIENCRAYKYGEQWKDFAKGMWDSMSERSENMLNSPNDFMNYLTMGIWNSNAENGNKMLETKNVYDIANWATMGGADMVNGAVNPEKPLSPEHWMNSFGVASTAFGFRSATTKYRNKDIVDIKEPYKKAVDDNKIEGGSKTNFENEIPRSGEEWNQKFIDEYGKENVYCNINSVDDIFNDPTRLKGYTADELQKVLGSDWEKGVYGSNSNGWKLMGGDVSIFYHPGGGIHGGSYYGISSGATGKIKVVDSKTYIPLKGDKATIIYN